MAAPAIPADLAQRMADHLRECAAAHPLRPSRDEKAQSNWDELHAIVALLPDPDIVYARAVAAESWREKHTNHGYGYGRDAALIEGKFDDSNDVRAALAGIKRGRLLALSVPA